jgi:branched-subunit amino acid aminotransferase/4-amino-4-deoxychorismate lyase
MHKVALFNGKIVDTEDVVIPAVSASAMYGHGVFSTISIYDGEPFLLEKHWRRLGSHARKLGLDADVASDQLESWLLHLLETNGQANHRARITLLDAGGAGLWSGRSAKRTVVLIVTGERVKRPDKFRLATSVYRVNSASPITGVKCCNYLDHLIAYEDAKRRGFDEAIRLNERGEVTSAAMANIFWLRDDELFTPSLETGCLAGTTREFILENFDVCEARGGIDELLNASAAFVSSAGIGIRQVASIDKKQFDLIDHEILHLLPPKTKTRMSAK